MDGDFRSPARDTATASGDRMLRATIALTAAAFLVAACSSNKGDELAFQDTPADQLYNEALVILDSGDTRTAIAKFEEIDRLHPYSEQSRRAMIMLAYASYKRGDYEGAINAARRFVALYPGHDDAPYAQYLIGNSYYRQMPDVTRDQEVTEKALQAMDELVRKWPESEYAEDARRKIAATRDQLAGKEMEVGRYYLMGDNHIAAVNRFRTVVENYQTTRHVEEALFRLTESYYAMGIVPEAQTAAAVLGHNFPDSRWYQRSFDLLKKGGYSPSENRNSWISRAFSGIKLL